MRVSIDESARDKFLFVKTITCASRTRLHVAESEADRQEKREYVVDNIIIQWLMFFLTRREPTCILKIS